MLVRDTPPGNVEKGKCTMPAEGSILGHAVLRREDPSLLTGADKYYDDMAVDGLTHAYFVRSSFAHGTLNSVDVSRGRDDAGRDRRPLGRHVRAGAVPVVPVDAARHRASPARQGQGAPRRRHRGGHRRRDAGAGHRRRPRRWSSTSIRCRRSSTPKRPSPTARRSCSRSTGRTWCSRPGSASRTATRSRVPPTWRNAARSASVWPAFPWRPTAASRSPATTASSRCGSRARTRSPSATRSPPSSAWKPAASASRHRWSAVASAPRPVSTPSTCSSVSSPARSGGRSSGRRAAARTWCRWSTAAGW